MQIISQPEKWQSIRKQIDPKLNIGFVPTLGNLHAGHASLLQRARAENEVVVLTLFINPTQFNDPKDYQSYPRTLESDLAVAQELGVDYVLIPDKEAMYPDNFTYKVSETEISQYQEGPFRPGHFTGMLTIVLKLLLLVNPQRAYLGEKDYQQLQLVRGMVKAFFLNSEIVACPTIREASGLPLSSRNNLFNAQERELANQFASIFQQTELTCAEIIQHLSDAGIQVDYLEDSENRRFAAVRVGRIRLIDNRKLPC